MNNKWAKLANILENRGLTETAKYADLCVAMAYDNENGSLAKFASINDILEAVGRPLAELAVKDKKAAKVLSDFVGAADIVLIEKTPSKPLDFKMASYGNASSNRTIRLASNQYAKMIQEISNSEYGESLVKIASLTPSGTGNLGITVSSKNGQEFDISFLWVPISWYEDYTGKEFDREQYKKAETTIGLMKKLALDGSRAPNLGAALGPDAPVPPVPNNPKIRYGTPLFDTSGMAHPFVRFDADGSVVVKDGYNGESTGWRIGESIFYSQAAAKLYQEQKKQRAQQNSAQVSGQQAVQKQPSSAWNLATFKTYSGVPGTHFYPIENGKTNWNNLKRLQPVSGQKTVTLYVDPNKKYGEWLLANYNYGDGPMYGWVHNSAVRPLAEVNPKPAATTQTTPAARPVAPAAAPRPVPSSPMAPENRLK